jgi:hypothetical protein
LQRRFNVDIATIKMLLRFNDGVDDANFVSRVFTSDLVLTIVTSNAVRRLSKSIAVRRSSKYRSSKRARICAHFAARRL